MEKKRKGWEIAVVVIVIIFSAAVLWFKFHAGERAAKDAAMIDEVRAVRTAVELYLVTNRVYPAELSELARKSYTMDGKKKPYLTGVKVDEDGYPVDSYGYRFIYEPKTGRVALTRRKYEGW